MPVSTPRDYKERVPALVEAGVDVLCIDSPTAISEWQYETLHWIGRYLRRQGTVWCRKRGLTKMGFNYLADAGADDFIKVRIGGGSICITREQKGIGRGQATALIDAARDEYFKRHGVYIPICSDGDFGTRLPHGIGVGWCRPDDGRYFACFDESPVEEDEIGNNFVKGIGVRDLTVSKNWRRFDMGGNESLKLRSCVDSWAKIMPEN